jgi:hypothetical protein
VSVWPHELALLRDSVHATEVEAVGTGVAELLRGEEVPRDRRGQIAVRVGGGHGEEEGEDDEDEEEESGGY